MSGGATDEHEAFAASRTSQYVFVPTKESFFNTLDQHADTGDKDVKLPLVVVGNDGSGKSALLSNWVEKRREHLPSKFKFISSPLPCLVHIPPSPPPRCYSVSLSHTFFLSFFPIAGRTAAPIRDDNDP